ncbi:hypothetical protein TBLA_0D01060 [Henningerozyma blattae CBS 6284]|uniref:Phosducin thioredoxin-like domain-containing protein n=1 Tax=Henningerozyma blattae (strain ATCC 34711 / CBS 6284 / DSM 70876 / NBRC 10599 / NRRL Y-10934 / UCD 77-7) TaxID=1071380 RepID=I2H2L2_HENB6|nr:hypothetical protein TBLA_0D01060 [Tetrapisispora blattae CBS 6284]CCH60614.1 hypothetical protein TBLA_0D01060 [Tetrapisispora blattae CBS 6284]
MGNDPLIQVQVDESEDTEWNDILRKHGVIPERPPSPTAQIEEALAEALEKQHENRLEGKDLSDLEELEDDEDEDFLEFYRQKRLAEIAKLQEKSKFGDVYHINKPEYNKEVTEASKGDAAKLDSQKSSSYLDSNEKDNVETDSKGIYVFVHLSLQSKLQSRILTHLFESSAKKYQEIKFVEIIGTRAIENYPEANCPTILVYYKGEVLKNMITLLELGGNDTNMKDFEKLMVQVGAVDEADKRLMINTDSDESQEERHLKFANKKSIRSGIKGKFDLGAGSYEDDHDDFFD